MGYNVLLVDDSDVTRTIIGKVLRLADVPLAELYEASNGKEALDILDEHWVDLVFADLNMPVMNGVEMIERMYDDGLLRTIPVVIVSTEGSTTRIEQLKAKGVRAYIRKPFTPEQIREFVTDILGDPVSVDDVRVQEVFMDVMEGFAYMFGDVVPAAGLTAPADPLEARMDFIGRLSGTARLAVSSVVCPRLAANVLGLEEDDPFTSEKAEDALREVLNMVVGNVLTDIAGDKALFDLAPPHVAPLRAKEWKEISSRPGTLAFVVDDEPMMLSFELAERR